MRIELTEEEKMIASMVGIPEDLLRAQKQAAYDEGLIDEDGNLIADDGDNDVVEAMEEPEGCDGDCEHCHLHDAEHPYTNEQLEDAAHRNEDALMNIFIKIGLEAFEIAKASVLDIPEDDRPIILEACKNGIMATVGRMSRGVHDTLAAAMGM